MCVCVYIYVSYAVMHSIFLVYIHPYTSIYIYIYIYTPANLVVVTYLRAQTLWLRGRLSVQPADCRVVCEEEAHRWCSGRGRRGIRDSDHSARWNACDYWRLAGFHAHRWWMINDEWWMVNGEWWITIYKSSTYIHAASRVQMTGRVEWAKRNQQHEGRKEGTTGQGWKEWCLHILAYIYECWWTAGYTLSTLLMSDVWWQCVRLQWCVWFWFYVVNIMYFIYTNNYIEL